MGMPEDETATCLFLIEQHLLLSSVMNGRDLSDPATARHIAASVGTIERLKLLTLLTYADISAVNPEAMTAWRSSQLWQAYLAGQAELTRELDSDRIHAGEQEYNAETREFLEGFPKRYLLTHNQAEIKRHIALAGQSKVTGVAIDLNRVQGVYRLEVLTHDRPRLLATIAGVLASFGMDIHKAEAFANQQGTVLDTFAFADPLRTLELNPPEVDRLKATLQRAILGREDVRRLLRGRPKPARAKAARQKASVHFDSEAARSATLVQIVAEDRPGLLYDLADAFSSEGCSIDVLLIDTEAHRANDVFYVTSEGGKLSPELEASLQHKLLAVCES
jgi:[protein-PII] uridylyltransferase